MTLATAQSIADSITAAGFRVEMTPTIVDGVVVDWTVIGIATTQNVTVNQAKQLQDAHGVVGSMNSVTYK